MRISVDSRFCRAHFALLAALSFAGAGLCHAQPRRAAEQSSSPGTEKAPTQTQTQTQKQTQTPAKPQTNAPAKARSDSGRRPQSQQGDSPPAADAQCSGKDSDSNTSGRAAEKQSPPKTVVVWANTASKVYHLPGSRWYGKTKHGRYMTERDAIKAGYHLAGKE